MNDRPFNPRDFYCSVPSAIETGPRGSCEREFNIELLAELILGGGEGSGR